MDLDLNLTLAIYWGRTIELLAFYFILANINGNSLKESFTELFITKQKNLYGNILVLIAYPLGLSVIAQIMRNQGWQDYSLMIDQILRPFIAYFLLRLVFNVKKALLTYLFSIGIGFLVGTISLIFSLNVNASHGIFIFFLTLIITIIMSSRNYFESIYKSLSKKRILMTVLLFLSLAFYLVTFFTVGFVIIFPIVLSCSLFLVLGIHLRKEGMRLVTQLKEANVDNFLQTLKELSAECIESKLTRHYVINNHNNSEFSRILSKKLELYTRRGTIEDYELKIEKRQIKINVILQK